MTTICLIGVVVVFPKEADAAMAVIIEEEIGPTTKITGIAINNKRHPLEIMFFRFSWNYIKQTSQGIYKKTPAELLLYLLQNCRNYIAAIRVFDQIAAITLPPW